MRTALGVAVIAAIILLGGFFWAWGWSTVNALADKTRSSAETLRDVTSTRGRDAGRRAGDAVQKPKEAVDAVSGTARSAADTAKDVTAEKVQQVSDKLEDLAARIEPGVAPATPTPRVVAAPSPTTIATSTPSTAPIVIAPAATPPAPPRDLGPSLARPPELLATPVAVATATSVPTAPAPTTATGGRRPWVLLPRPEPGSRVAAGGLVVEARGRGDAPITQIRLAVDDAALPVVLEQRSDEIWRGLAQTRVAAGPHRVNAVVVDAAGRSGSYRWEFTAAP